MSELAQVAVKFSPMDNADSSQLAEHHCPTCDYDLRGLTKPRCPECGKAFSTRDVAEYQERRWPPQRFFRTLILATIPWFVAYVFVDAIHDTLDRARLTWLTLPFLAISLQFALASVASGALEASSKRGVKRIGAGLVIIVWILILGHIAITLYTL